MQLEGDEGYQIDEDEVKDVISYTEVEVDSTMNGSSSVPAPRTAGKRAWWPVALTTTMRQARDMLPQSVNEVMRSVFVSWL